MDALVSCRVSAAGKAFAPATPAHAAIPRQARPAPWRQCAARRSARRSVEVLATRFGSRPAVCSATADTPHLQLATAKLPGSVDPVRFVDRLYQWAATLTVSGQNLPFVLPLKVRKVQQTGVQISLLTIVNGEPSPVAVIEASVEEEPGVGEVLFVRFLEGPGAQADRAGQLPAEPQKRLRTILEGLPDIPILMDSMKKAIRQAVASAS